MRVSGSVVLGLVGWRGFCRVRGRAAGRPPERRASGQSPLRRRAAPPGLRPDPLQALKTEKSCLLDCKYGMVNTAEGVMTKQSLVFSVKMMIVPHNRHPL